MTETRAKEWDDSRWEELELLRTLLFEVSKINSATNCLDRIAKCVEMAERLNSWSKDRRCASFFAFLQNLAEREAKAQRLNELHQTMEENVATLKQIVKSRVEGKAK